MSEPKMFVVGDWTYEKQKGKWYWRCLNDWNEIDAPGIVDAFFAVSKERDDYRRVLVGIKDGQGGPRSEARWILSCYSAEVSDGS